MNIFYDNDFVKNRFSQYKIGISSILKNNVLLNFRFRHPLKHPLSNFHLRLLSGLGPNASYIGVVWGFMTFKWALILLLSARRFRKQYREIEGNTMVINDDIE